MPDRVYSEQEATEIIRRAVRLDEEQAAYQPGVTQDELERIAAEVGVSPEALRRALQEVTAHKEPDVRFALVREVERVVEGELHPDDFDVVVEGVKPLANAGQPYMAQVGRTLTLSAWTGTGQAKVNLTSRGGRTRLTVRSNALTQFFMSAYPAFVAAVVSTSILAESGMGALGLPLGTMFLGAGALAFHWLTKKGHRDAEKLADRLSERVAETVGERAGKGMVEAVEEAVEDVLGQG